MKPIFLGILFLISHFVFSQKDTLDIKEFEVVSFQEYLPKTFTKHELDSTQIKRFSSTPLPKLINYLTPLSLKTYGGGGISTISSRGMSAEQTKIYWNGFQINSSTLGMLDLWTVPTSSFQKLEFHSGNASVFDGNGGAGGALIMANTFLENDSLYFSFQSELASFNTYSSSASLHQKKNKWAYYIGAGTNRSDNNYSYRIDNSDSVFVLSHGEIESKNGFIGIKYEISKNSLLFLNSSYFESNRNVPSIITESKNAFSEQIDKRWLNSLGYVYTKDRIKIEWNNGAFYDLNHYKKESAEIDSKIEIKSIKSILNGTYTSKFYKCKASINADRDEATSGGFVGKKKWSRVGGIVSTEGRILKPLFLSSSLRYETVNGLSSGFLPTVGALIQVIKPIALKANWGKNMRFPTMNDLYWFPGGNVSLKPEEASTLETGLIIQSLITKKSNASLNAVYYWADLRNKISWLPTGGYWSVLNFHHVKSQGIETEMKLQGKIQKVDVFAFGNYNYTHTQNLVGLNDNDASIGKELIYVPKHLLKYGVSMNAKKLGLTLGFFSVHQSRRYISTDNKWYLPYHDLLNVYLGKQFDWRRHSFQFTIEVDNLTNEQYQSVAWRPMPGRNYAIRFTYDFH